MLANQAQEVFYVDDMKLGVNWKVVNQVYHRQLWDVLEVDEIEDSFESTDNVV